MGNTNNNNKIKKLKSCQSSLYTLTYLLLLKRRQNIYHLEGVDWGGGEYCIIQCPYCSMLMGIGSVKL